MADREGAPMSASGSPAPSVDIAQIDRETKMRLAGFVCLYAWADKQIHPTERKMLQKLVTSLRLSPTDAAKVEGWLQTPPPLEYSRVDAIPPALRAQFLEHA